MDRLFAARKRVHGPGRIPDLCGAVLHVSGWYVLWQEGPQAAVDTALAAVRQRRHGTQRLVHRSVGPRTLVEPLALSTTQWHESPEQFDARIAAAARLAGDDPRELWHLLSEPCTLSDPSQPRRHRLGVLAADDQRSIEMARRLAEHCRRPLVYRRFAGADPGTADVGAAYFDLPLEGRPLRVQAVSRRAFSHSLVRESLGAAERIALLVGDQAGRATELAAGVAAFVQRAGTLPPIELVALSPEVGSAAAGLLRERVTAPVTQRTAALGEAQLMALLLGVGPAA